MRLHLLQNNTPVSGLAKKARLQSGQAVNILFSRQKS